MCPPVCNDLFQRQPSPLLPGNLSQVPHYSFAEYDATVAGAVDLLVVPYIPDARTVDPQVLAGHSETTQARPGAAVSWSPGPPPGMGPQT